MNWLTDEQYRKMETLLRFQYIEVMKPFEKYGLNAYIPGAVEEQVKLAIDFSLVVRGQDKPISIKYIRRKR